MRKQLIPIALILASFAAALAQETDLQAYLPRPDSDQGWRFDLQPARYAAENLFEYINGEAELYNDYHFVEMVTAAYIQGDNMEMTYTIDISDMGSPLDAFGIYSSYRSPSLQFAEIGTEATISELNIRFFKGRFLVQLNAGSFNKGLHKCMLAAAHALAGQLPGAPAPREYFLLPQQNQLPHTLKYVTRGFLGQSVFPAGLTASYAVQGDTLQAFLVLTQTTGQSLPAFAAFAASLKERGTILQDGAGKIEVETPYQGRILALHHLHWIAGVMGYKKTEQAEALLPELLSPLGE